MIGQYFFLRLTVIARGGQKSFSHLLCSYLYYRRSYLVLLHRSITLILEEIKIVRMSNPEIPMHAALKPVRLSLLLPQPSLVNGSVGGNADRCGRVIHQCLGRVSHCHMSVRAWAALIASVRHLSPTSGKEEGDGSRRQVGE